MTTGTLYMNVYDHYRKMIESGEMRAGDRMPSLRRTCAELNVSKTTAENAYFQLAADGYIISRERSGFFVSSAAVTEHVEYDEERTEQLTVRYDMSKIGEDSSAFCYDLWQRYMKSVMRDTERLVTYGDHQGEPELREELARYVRKRRNIICTPDRIVVGASTQSLLILLLTILKSRGAVTASVPATGFDRFARTFTDAGIRVGYRNKEADIIYVSPARMTQWGEAMTLKRRHEILEHSRRGHLIIEDDYQNEFNFAGSPGPSIYALSGGAGVVYTGSFSRVLLPAIRISFMILPEELTEIYSELGPFYDQTASKTEQLALCQFLRDDQLNRHIKKLRKLYGAKRELLTGIVKRLAEERGYDALIGECGTEAAIMAPGASEDELVRWLSEKEIACRMIRREDGILMLFSCGTIGKSKLTELQGELIYY